MTKELIINASIPLPPDYLDETDIVSKVRPVVAAFRQGLCEAIGEDAFTCYVEAREPPKERAKRKPRADVGQPRGPRGPRATVNGPDQPPAA